MYNPHEKPNLSDEMEAMSKGRLVKVCLSDQPPPNVGWFWIMTGNCHACKYYQTYPPKCLNAKITDAQFFDLYMLTNTCPEFEAGIAAKSPTTDKLDVMKAIGLVKGKPAHAVTVIVNEPWSMPLAIRAHREQSIFLNMAAQADSPHPDADYVDMADDLERPTPAPQSP